jgi:hypothetical protein
MYLYPSKRELLLKHRFNTALAVFAAAQFCFGLLGVPFFRGEDSSAGDHSQADVAPS